MTTFGAWLRTQTHRADAIGDLARDYTARCLCPGRNGRTTRATSPAGIRTHLSAHYASPSAHNTLTAAATEWRRS